MINAGRYPRRVIPTTASIVSAVLISPFDVRITFDVGVTSLQMGGDLLIGVHPVDWALVFPGVFDFVFQTVILHGAFWEAGGLGPVIGANVLNQGPPFTGFLT